MFHRVHTSGGFALPTILIASTVLMIVLTVAAAAAASVSASLSNQYYSQLANEAAESGLSYARYCYEMAAPSATSSQWPNAGTLTQGTNCYGTPETGQNCTNAPGTQFCGIVNTSTVRTTFSVGAPALDSHGASYSLEVTGTTQLLRSGDHQVYQSTTKTLDQQVSINLYGIASGNDTTCSIQAGQLFCWGKNDSGQVGNGTTSTAVTTPYHVQNFPPVGGVNYNYVQYVATGISHTCAVVGIDATPTDGNQVYCWGDNSLGQLGTGNTTSSTVPVPGASGLDTSNRVVGCDTGIPNCTPISARDHTCVMVLPKAGSGLSSDVEYCWGQDNGGQAGQVTTDQTDLPSPSIKTSVGLAIRKQGNFVMYYVSTLGNVSGEFACAVNGTALGQTSGALYCWGDDYYGELGNGTRSTGTQMYATPVSNLQSNVTDVATNNGRACALMSGTLYCWGENGTGGTTGGTVDYRLDSGPTFSSQNAVPTPQPLITSTSSPQYGATITDFAITDWDTCVVISGNVWCSGYNDLGQLGQGTVSGPARGTATSPSQVVSANNMVEVKGALAGQKVVQITSGNDHFCAITSTHASYCWGENDLGQLGNGSTVSSPAPTPVHIPATVIF